MAELNHFRIYEIAQDANGEPLELARQGDYVVCLGFDTARRRFVEINALGGGDGDRFLERAAAVASQPHPSLATVVDSGIEEGVAFYAADIVDGEALEDYRGRVKAVPFEAASAWLSQIAQGAALLASEGLLPQIGSARLVIDSDGVISARIVDFGIVVAADAGAVIGDDLSRFLKALTNYQAEGEEPVYPPEVGDVCAELYAETDPARCAALLSGGRDGVRAPVVGESMRPRLMLERAMFQRARPEHILPSRLRPLRRAGDGSPYESTVEDIERGGRLRILVLPPDRFVSEQLLDVYEETAAPEVLAVSSFWKHDDFRLLAENLKAGFSLGDWIRSKPDRPGLETVAILKNVDAAINRLTEASVRPRALSPDDILLEFESETEDNEILLSQIPSTRWPVYQVRVRTHPTMQSLSGQADDSIPDGAEDVLSAAGKGGALPSKEVFAWYFNLRNRGLGYQAGELVESLRDAVGSPSDEQELDSPAIARPTTVRPMDRVLEEEEPDEIELEEATISPIAAAMGISEADLVDEGDQAAPDELTNPIAQQVVYGRPLGEQSDDRGRLGEVEADEDEEEEVIEEVSPFAGLQKEAGEAPLDVGDLLGDEASREMKGGGASILLLLFILLVSVAIAAAIAHLTGRAFWLQ